MKKTRLLLLALLFTTPVVQADFNTGVVAYLTGDYETAYNTMISLADTSDDAMAQYWVGVMHLKGQGVEQNYEEAGKWFRRAAEQSIPQAQYKLGRLYSDGTGVPQDNEFAYVWYSVAAAHQHKKGMNAAAGIKSELSDEEMKEANKLIDDYVEKYGPKEKVDPNKPIKIE
ncbi:MAG: sel1 repeat family protein [Thiotrichales bacterium]|nr:sel1 repeat family protein [Thiotrichales bacterium]